MNLSAISNNVSAGSDDASAISDDAPARSDDASAVSDDQAGLNVEKDEGYGTADEDYLGYFTTSEGVNGGTFRLLATSKELGMQSAGGWN